MTEFQTGRRAADEPGRQDGKEDGRPAGSGRPEPEPQPGRTLWRPLRKTPLRKFLQTETGSAAILTGAVLAALIWANVSGPANRGTCRPSGGPMIAADARLWSGGALSVRSLVITCPPVLAVARETINA